MPKVLADYGSTLLVEFPDGTRQEVIRDSFEKAFPGGTYPDQPPLGATQPVSSPLGGPPGPAPKPPSYNTELTAPEEQQFDGWVQQNNVPFDPSAKDSDYDMRGFWKGMQSGDPRATAAINPSDQELHYPDTWKTPRHKTFSNESIYADESAPHWQDDRLIDSRGKVIADESVPDALEPNALGSKPALGTPTLQPPAAPARGPSSTPLHDPSRGSEIQTLPEYAQGTRELGATRVDAAQEAGDLESAELARTAGLLDEHDRRAQQVEAERLDAHKQGLAAADKKLAEIDQLGKEFTEGKIDRGRYLANKSTGDRIMMGIGLGLSVMGQSLMGQGGPNPAVGIIMEAIDKDVADQRYELEKKGKAVELKRGLYKEFLDRLGNKQAAYDMSVAVSAAQTKRQIEIIGAQSQSEKVKVQARDLAAQLGQVVADKQELIRQSASADAYRDWQMRLAELKRSGSGRGTAKPGTTGPQGVWTKGEGKPLPLDVAPGGKNYERVAYFGDQPFLAGTPAEAKEITDGYTQNANAIRQVSSMRASADKVGFADDYVVTKSELAKAFDVDQVFALMNLKNAFGLGVLSGEGENSDVNLVKSLLGGGNAKWGDIKGILKRTEQNLEQSFTESARAKGYKGPIRFDRVESPGPPQSWDRSAKNVMDTRLVRQDRIGSIDRMVTGMKREGMALDTQRQTLSGMLETIDAERAQKKAALDQAEQQASEGGVVTADVLNAARLDYGTADQIYTRLVAAKDQLAQKEKDQEADEKLRRSPTGGLKSVEAR